MLYKQNSSAIFHILHSVLYYSIYIDTFVFHYSLLSISAIKRNQFFSAWTKKKRKSRWLERSPLKQLVKERAKKKHDGGRETSLKALDPNHKSSLRTFLACLFKMCK